MRDCGKKPNRTICQLVSLVSTREMGEKGGFFKLDGKWLENKGEILM